MAGKNRWPAQKERKNLLFLLLFVPFGSLRDLDDACPPLEGKSLCSGLLTQILCSPRNTYTGTPRNNVLPVIWASLSRVKLTHKS